MVPWMSWHVELSPPHTPHWSCLAVDPTTLSHPILCRQTNVRSLRYTPLHDFINIWNEKQLMKSRISPLTAFRTYVFSIVDWFWIWPKNQSEMFIKVKTVNIYKLPLRYDNKPIIKLSRIKISVNNTPSSTKQPNVIQRSNNTSFNFESFVQIFFEF